MLNNNNDTITELLPSIRKTVARFLVNKCPDAIDDVVNDVVCVLLSGGLDKCDGRASLKSWATITARNTAINYLKSARVRHGHDAISGTGSETQTKDRHDRSTSVELSSKDMNAIERDMESRDLARALAAVLDAQELAFAGALADGHSLVKATEIAGADWSEPTASRKRKAIADKLRHLR